MTAKAISVRNHMHKTKVSRAVAVLMERDLIGGSPAMSTFVSRSFR